MRKRFEDKKIEDKPSRPFPYRSLLELRRREEESVRRSVHGAREKEEPRRARKRRRGLKNDDEESEKYTDYRGSYGRVRRERAMYGNDE